MRGTEHPGPCPDCSGSQDTHMCCSCFGTGIDPAVLAREGYNPYEGLKDEG